MSTRFNTFPHLKQGTLTNVDVPRPCRKTKSFSNFGATAEFIPPFRPHPAAEGTWERVWPLFNQECLFDPGSMAHVRQGEIVEIPGLGLGCVGRTVGRRRGQDIILVELWVNSWTDTVLVLMKVDEPVPWTAIWKWCQGVKWWKVPVLSAYEGPAQHAL